MVIAVALGGTVGLVAGYFGGTLDRMVMRLIEVKVAFLGLLLAWSS